MKLSEEKIIHAQLMPELARFFPSLCTIGNVVQTQDAANQPIDTWQDNPLLQNIRCLVQPASGMETRSRQQTIEINQWLIGLDGFYPTITQSDQATVDSEIYNILRVAHDDHETATYLTVEKVS